MADEYRFEWDAKKSAANRRKHGIDFGFARRVFGDPMKRLEIEGDEHGEIRWRATGAIDRTLYVVTYTLRQEGEEEIHRLISARKATPRDRNAFEESS